MNLNGKWFLRGTDKLNNEIYVEATVPGCVHTDLINCGIIKDLYYRDNTKLYKWIEDKDFTYERTFVADKVEDNAFIEFDGLDTYCDVYLNDTLIGKSENMFVPCSFNVDGVLKAGENKIKVCFRSAVKEVEGKPELPGAFTRERLHTRRMQCTYGWDWVDRFVTAGIYKDVRLVFRKKNEIDNIYVYTKSITPYGAQINADICFRDVIAEEDNAKIEILSPENEVLYSKERTILKKEMYETFTITDPQLWYPAGYGEQPLYKLIVTTPSSKKEVVFGIREITVLQPLDKPGSAYANKCKELQANELYSAVDRNEKTSGFTVVVNGIKIMCKGGNWVPCEPFPSAETPEKIRKLLELGRAGGVNMIRVWGGGIFEQDFFYDECDRLGILVTQDFLMACGLYPEKEEWFIEALNKEAESVALRLRNHPSIAWWSGDNENGMRGNENITKFNGYFSATYGVEPILRKLDPNRLFFPSSPYGGDYYMSVTVGTAHNTNYQGHIFKKASEGEWDGYTEYFSSMISRFSVEQSCLGLPFASCLKKFMTEEDIYGESTEISEFHTKNGGCTFISIYGTVDEMSKKIFGPYKNGRDRVLKQQMLQCEWIRTTFEAHRRNMWFSSGLLYWMFNDCWPAANGWSIIDYYGNPKPSYYTFKRCAKPVVVSLEKANEAMKVYVSNIAPEECSGTGKLYVYDFEKKTKLSEKVFNFKVPENSAEAVFECDLKELATDNNSIILCDINSSQGNDRTFYIKETFGKLNLNYEEAEIVNEDENSVTFRANAFIPFVVADLPYVLEDNCFTMLPGEEITVKKVI